MSKKHIIFIVLIAIVLIGGFFWCVQKRQTALNQSVVESSMNNTNNESVDTVVSPSRFLENAPDIQSRIDARYPIKNLDTTNWDTYQSPSGFSVKIPKGTMVEVKQEGFYTITYFKSKGSTHIVHVYSHEGNVNQKNLDEQIRLDSNMQSTGRYDASNQFQCLERAVCFLSPMYADKTETDPNPPLMFLFADVISKDPYPFFYQIHIGDYHPPLTQQEINLYAAILKTFQLTR